MKKPVCVLAIAFLLVCFFASLHGVSASTTYTFEGPYYDDRTVVNGAVTVTLRYANDSIYSFDLVGDGATPDSETVVSSSVLTTASWNASTALNMTRVYDFLGASDNSLDIHIPTVDGFTYEYVFSVSDFYGLKEPYIETLTTDDGSTWYSVERKAVQSGTMTFVLTQYYDYLVRLYNDPNGDVAYYDWTFKPQNVLTNDIIITAGMFPAENLTGVLATAIRTDETTITVTYEDGDEITDWLYLQISHYVGGFEVLDYYINVSDTDSYSLVWNTADSETEYRVYIESYRNSDLWDWSFSVGVLASSNPFDGILDFLGTLPEGVDGSQLVASGIIIAFLCIGSFRSVGASCVVAWIVGGILLFLGWWGPSIPTFILAGVLSVLFAIDEAKETTREV